MKEMDDRGIRSLIFSRLMRTGNVYGLTGRKITCSEDAGQYVIRRLL